MAKLNREALAHFIDGEWHASFDAVTTQSAANWVIVGDDIEDMSMELNPDTETFKNILGQTKVTDNGYEPSMDADPFYADPDSALYTKLRDIAMNRQKGDACKTLLLEVIVDNTEATSHSAWVQEVIVKPQSYGGDTAGFNIPFNVMENGKRTAGTVTLSNGVPTFTAASA